MTEETLRDDDALGGFFDSALINLTAPNVNEYEGDLVGLSLKGLTVDRVH